MSWSEFPKDVQTREWAKFFLDDDGEVAVRTSGKITGEIKTRGLSTAGKVTEVTLDSAVWTPLPAIPLTDRNAMGIQNVSAQDIKVNFDPTVLGFVGMVIGAGSERTYDITDAIIVYARCSSGSVTINVEEIS